MWSGLPLNDIPLIICPWHALYFRFYGNNQTLFLTSLIEVDSRSDSTQQSPLCKLIHQCVIAVWGGAEQEHSSTVTKLRMTQPGLTELAIIEYAAVSNYWPESPASVTIWIGDRYVLDFCARPKTCLEWCEPVWPSGKAALQRGPRLDWFRFGSLFTSKAVVRVDTVLWLCRSQLMKH